MYNSSPKLIKSKSGWHIYWRQYNPSTKSWKSVRKSFNLNRITDKKVREETAKQILLELGVKPKNKHYVIEEKLAVEKLFELAQHKLKNSNWELKRTYVNIFRKLETYIHSNELKEFGKTDAILFMEDVLNQNYSNTYYNNIKVTLSVFFNLAVQKGFITYNPFRAVKKRKSIPQAHKAFNNEQINTVFSHLQVNNPTLYRFAMFMYYSFIRRNELCRIQVTDILEDRILISPKISKTGKSRTVLIHPRLKKVINEMRLQNYPENYYVFDKLLNVGSVQLKYTTRISDKFRVELRQIGFNSPYSLYSLKHSGVVAAYIAGVDVYDIMTQCGHSDLNMTLVYLRSLGMIKENSIVKVDY